MRFDVAGEIGVPDEIEFAGATAAQQALVAAVVGSELVELVEDRVLINHREQDARHRGLNLPVPPHPFRSKASAAVNLRAVADLGVEIGGIALGVGHAHGRLEVPVIAEIEFVLDVWRVADGRAVCRQHDAERFQNDARPGPGHREVGRKTTVGIGDRARACCCRGVDARQARPDTGPRADDRQGVGCRKDADPRHIESAGGGSRRRRDASGLGGVASPDHVDAEQIRWRDRLERRHLGRDLVIGEGAHGIARGDAGERVVIVQDGSLAAGEARHPRGTPHPAALNLIANVLQDGSGDVVDDLLLDVLDRLRVRRFT